MTANNQITCNEVAGWILETAEAQRSEASRAESASGRSLRGAMKFWDASALIPLCLQEEASSSLKKLVQAAQSIEAWWRRS